MPYRVANKRYNVQSTKNNCEHKTKNDLTNYKYEYYYAAAGTSIKLQKLLNKYTTKNSYLAN